MGGRGGKKEYGGHNYSSQHTIIKDPFHREIEGTEGREREGKTGGESGEKEGN